MIFGKTVVKHLWILSEKLNFLKTHKNSYMGPLCIIDLQYEGYEEEIQSFGQVYAQN
jgi:hypothetical protein